MTAAATTGGEVQPSDGASMTAYTSAINPAADSAAPAQSRRPASALRDSGMARRPTTIATTQSGTLTRKIEPHEKLSSRNPPATGPRATPSPAVAAQMPTAVARSRSSGNTLMSSDSVAGMMKAAPAPITARQAIRASTFAARRRRRRARGEHGEAGEERAPAPVSVSERAGEQQQPREDERVGVDHPLQLAHVGVELPHQGGERDVHDRVVDDDGEQAQTEDAERDPARAAHDVTAAVAATSAVRRSRARSTTAKAISHRLHRT